MCEGGVQVKGQGLAAMAVGWYQRLMGHRLQLGEVAERGMVVVWGQDALRVEAPPVICTATEGVNTLATGAAWASCLGASHLRKAQPRWGGRGRAPQAAGNPPIHEG